jgi:hypothetical protein
LLCLSRGAGLRCPLLPLRRSGSRGPVMLAAGEGLHVPRCHPGSNTWVPTITGGPPRNRTVFAGFAIQRLSICSHGPNWKPAGSGPRLRETLGGVSHNPSVGPFLSARLGLLAGVLGFDPTRTGFGVRPASHGSPLNWLAALGSNQSQSRLTGGRPHPED